MQITSAMKMVSAAKLKKAQDAIQDLRPYADKLREILGNISGSIEQTEGSFTEVREVKKVLLVLITSNRGLCGAFNANIIKLGNRAISEHQAQGREGRADGHREEGLRWIQEEQAGDRGQPLRVVQCTDFRWRGRSGQRDHGRLLHGSV